MILCNSKTTLCTYLHGPLTKSFINSNLGVFLAYPNRGAAEINLSWQVLLAINSQFPPPLQNSIVPLRGSTGYRVPWSS